MTSPEYVLYPADDLSNLVYLPNGLGASQTGLGASERAEAMALLKAEVATAALSDHDTADWRPEGFLAALHEAILESFARTVVDSQAKNSLGAWIATQCLADELALCVDYKDTTGATIAGLRSMLASFLAKRGSATPGGDVLFLFRLAEHQSEEELDRWIESYLVMDETDFADASTYRTEQLPHNLRLAGPYLKPNTYFYKQIIASLGHGKTPDFMGASPELKALLMLLDPSARSLERSLSVGLLANASLQELVRLVEWYEGEGILPVETDEEGERLLRGVLETRLISKIIRGRSHRK